MKLWQWIKDFFSMKNWEPLDEYESPCEFTWDGDRGQFVIDSDD